MINGRRRPKNSEDLTCEEAGRSRLLHVTATPIYLGRGTQDIGSAEVCQTKVIQEIPACTEKWILKLILEYSSLPI